MALTQKERMVNNLPYKPWLDGLSEDRADTKKKIFTYNHMEPGPQQEAFIREILGSCGEHVHV